MSFLDQLTDRYNRTARLVPALLVLLPILLYCILAIPAATETWTKVVSVASFCLPFLLSQAVRDQGLKIEPKLFQKWGVRPSEGLLRWQSANSVSVIERRHSLIRSKLGISLPTKDQEAADPSDADAIYSAAIAALRERTRDKGKFPLLFEENISYGFRRNCYGCRVPVMIVSVLAGVAAAVLAWYSIVPLGWKQQTLLIAFDIGWVLIWLLTSNQEAVRRAATKYAEQLLVSLEVLDASTSGQNNEDIPEA
jgi:hypothetical protein